MKQDFFTKLPTEIIIKILLGLPFRTIMSCKCVCKSLLKLVKSREFAASHLAESAPGQGLAVLQRTSRLYKIYEIKDVLNLEYHVLHYHLLAKFSSPNCGCIHGCKHRSANGLPYGGFIDGSASGLLFLVDVKRAPNSFCICNPITRDYVKLHRLQRPMFRIPAYGFGASKISGQYKVVVIFESIRGKPHEVIFESIRNGKPHEFLRIFECQVYTLGTRSWRSIDPGPIGEIIKLDYSRHRLAPGAFVNGNLYWLVSDLRGSYVIACFDLETELFSTLSLPPHLRERSLLELSALGDYLCLCDNSSKYCIKIWLMKEYGVSWTLEYVIKKSSDIGIGLQVVCPMKVFRDGDILMAVEDCLLFFYSSKNETLEKIDFFGTDTPWTINSILYTPSFLSLKSFPMEDVKSF